MTNCPTHQPPMPMPVYPIIRDESKTYSGKDVRPFLVLRILTDYVGNMLSRKQIRQIASEEHRENCMTDHIIERAVVTAREAGFPIETFMASPTHISATGRPSSKYVKYYKLSINHDE